MEFFAGFGAVDIAVALVAAFVAAYIRGIAGFGMAIVLVPVLALALTPVQAVLVTNGIAVGLGLSEIRNLLRNAERSALVIGFWVVLATAPGLWLLNITPADLARVLIAFVALSAFGAVLLPQRAAEIPGPMQTAATGVAAGLLTGFAGMPGPPVVPYYVGRAIPRVAAKASMLLIFTIAAAAGLASGAALGLLDWRDLLLAVLLLPAVWIGNWLGSLAFGKISDRTWRAFVALVLFATATVALLKLLQG
ncbi:MAG: hypothetical protein DI637_06155 [Citromicrobium sp.]|nr:MAG: hypothetical protein DI637_06155 [Citromicrobium sp.]